MIHLRLLGAYELVLDGAVIKPPATAKARSLLSYLALRRDEWIRRETLMGELWPEADTQSARNNLKTALYAIRRALRDGGADPDTLIVAKRDAMRWIAPTSVDSREFERRSIDVDDERRSAISIYRGEFAPGDENEWAQYTRARLAILFEQMLRRELAVRPTSAIAERLLALDPFSDEAYLALIETALQAFDRRTAQAVYRRYAAALAEIDMLPPSDLASRLGLGKSTSAEPTQLVFSGRSDELAELTYLLDKSGRAVVLSGIPGIGKTALAYEARRFLGDDQIAIYDVTQRDVDQRCRGLLEKLSRSRRAILCAEPEIAMAIRPFMPDSEQLDIGPLAYDEIVVAMRRHFPQLRAELVDAVWKRSQGYPLVLQAIAVLLHGLSNAASAASIERLRLSRDVERRFEKLLHAAGDDAFEIAVLLGLEPQLDNDDLATLLDWHVTRAREARERLGALGVAYLYCAEAALRTLSPSRREDAIERIAERLKLREDPNAKVRLAEHFLELGRGREAAGAYLEAGVDFAAASAWENAVRVVDAGIDIVESQMTSPKALDLLRELQLVKGRAQYQQGSFIAAVRSLEAVVEISDETTHGVARGHALVLMGNALCRANMLQPAREIAQQALDESLRSNDIRSELGAQLLLARVLRDRFLYDDSVSVASAGFERCREAREWTTAGLFATIIVEVSRRRLQFNMCFYWTQRQLEVALLAGPLIEAETRHMLGSVKVSLNNLDEAIQEFRHALPLIERYRRRNAYSLTPLGHLEWMMHHALAYTYTMTGDFDEAVAEAEWLVRSPWMSNSGIASWQALSVFVDARLAIGTPRDVAAVRMLLERVPVSKSADPRMCMETLARAKAAAYTGSDQAPALLTKAFKSLNAASVFFADQIHAYFYRLAQAARGVDDVLADRAAEAARHHEQRVIEAAGELWTSRQPATVDATA